MSLLVASCDSVKKLGGEIEEKDEIGSQDPH